MRTKSEIQRNKYGLLLEKLTELQQRYIKKAHDPEFGDDWDASEASAYAYTEALYWVKHYLGD